MYLGWATARNAQFLSLQSAVFCAECELISENNTPYCLACGSKAMLSLSRVLGGSLRGQETAHVIADVELDRLVRDLLRTVPEPAHSPEKRPAASVLMQASRHHLRTVGVFDNGRLREEIIGGEPEIRPSELNLEPGIHIIAERAQSLTGATGAAIALRAGNEIVCRARTGRTAPDLGVHLQTDSGLSAECVRTGEITPLPRRRNQPQGRSGELPQAGSAFDSGGSPSPLPQHPGRLRSLVVDPVCLRSPRRIYDAVAVQRHGGGDDAPFLYVPSPKEMAGLDHVS